MDGASLADSGPGEYFPGCLTYKCKKWVYPDTTDKQYMRKNLTEKLPLGKLPIRKPLLGILRHVQLCYIFRVVCKFSKFFI